jgi:GTP-binding protein HflX
MKTPPRIGTSRPRERALLVGVATHAQQRALVEEYLSELALLAESAGARVLHRIIQERPGIDAATYIGKGKAEEVGWLVGEEAIDLVLFDDDLSSVQVRNLERIIACKILDRSGLILDIFASRARTAESKVQVELAQLQYLLSRLTRQWTHLSKQVGGIGMKGPGETQIETDRRAIRSRIAHLKERLARIGRERAEQRKGRENLPRVALVGYTNAGKSTLMNLFSSADVLVEDRLFATLDSTVRMLQLTPAHRILLSDTVGFIRKLPHNLVASFKSTLDEVREADVLLHAVDVSHPLFEEHIAVVNETLEELGAQGKPTVTVFNKIDLLKDRGAFGRLAAGYPNPVFVSATRGINVGGLRDRIVSLLDETVAEETLVLGQDQYQILSRIHDEGEVMEKEYHGDAIRVRFRMRKTEVERLKKELGAATRSGRAATSQPARKGRRR